MNGFIRCAECGKLVMRGTEEMVFADGRFYCSECAPNVLFECPRCGEMHVVANAQHVNTSSGTEQWCEDCVERHAFFCEHCEEYYSDDDFEEYRVDGEHWCEDCTENEAYYCEECDEYHTEGEYVDSIDSWVCTDCLERDFVRCERCGDYIRSWRATEVRGGDYVCESCLEYYYNYCDECNEWVEEDEYDFDAEMCCDCANSLATSSDDDRVARSSNARVRGYHCAPPMRWFGDCLPSWLSVMRGKGVELEVDASYDAEIKLQRALNQLDALCGDRIYFEHDGSLNRGFEIITHPHTMDAFSEIPWKEIMDICTDNGFSSHDVGTCGLHIHYSRELFGADSETQDDNIAKLLQFFELYYDEIVKVSRRTSAQLQWAGKYNVVGKSKVKKMAKDKVGSHGRAVNMANTHTVELRIMRGTLNYETFLACNDFLDTVVKNSCRIGWSDTTDAHEWLRGLKPETIAYLNSRSAFSDALRELRAERGIMNAEGDALVVPF